MGIYKHPKSSVYYANFFDTNGKRQRISLQTKDKRIAEIKFADIRRRQTALKQGVYVNISWDIFKENFKQKFNSIADKIMIEPIE